MKANDIIENAKKTIKDGIAEMQATLSCLVLDGTPYVLITEVNGIACYYGTPGNKPTAFHGYINYGHLLSGTHQFSLDSAQRNVEHLATKGMKVEYRHWRDILTENLMDARRSLAMLEAMPA